MMDAVLSRLPHLPLNRLPFSMPSFLHGLGGGVCVIALLGTWMALRGDDTRLRVQADMPSKTAIIEWIESKPETPVIAEEKPALEETPPSANALPRAPVEGLYETVPAGRLPIADLRTGDTPFNVYKKAFTPVPGRPPVAVMFTGAGLSDSLSDGIIADLPDNVSVAVSPYALAPASWMEKIRADGHEVWLTLPLQNDTYPEPDPGPNTILSSVSLEQNQDRLLKILGTGVGYAGLISLDDHNFTADNTHIVPVMQQIFGRGLGFIDGRTDRPFFAADLAKAQSYPYASATLTLGEDLSVDAVKAALASAEKTALERGQAIVFARSTPANIRGVTEWAAGLDARGLQLAPVSALVAQ